MVACNSEKIIKQYSRSITTIARFDYPERWPTLTQTDIAGALSSNNPKGMYIGVLALFSLVKKYEYEMDEDREPLYPILSESFGIFSKIIGELLAMKDNEDVLRILYLICKVFYVGNQLVIAPFLVQSGQIDMWMNLFEQLMAMPLPENLTSFTEDSEQI
jgi:hypothetical protein